MEPTATANNTDPNNAILKHAPPNPQRPWSPRRQATTQALGAGEKSNASCQTYVVGPRLPQTNSSCPHMGGGTVKTFRKIVWCPAQVGGGLGKTILNVDLDCVQNPHAGPLNPFVSWFPSPRPTRNFVLNTGALVRRSATVATTNPKPQMSRGWRSPPSHFLAEEPRRWAHSFASAECWGNNPPGKPAKRVSFTIIPDLLDRMLAGALARKCLFSEPTSDS